MRLRFLKIYIWSIALYGCKMWTVRMLEKKNIEASENAAGEC